ncbi:branched-chain amino acid ABC transporter substrate-binding protein [Usitatibacter palustris]|uniref:Leucine-, isoleucine-, valine-, threonine-, and alanine-binding protein n=1 Tax=Usitatibacter palustris TaxID=2732487 RepID=A0A6M4H201_9PROT|nr:branched-chain amino acid ABC transporter substrate-binding protein [Usitatibacter palustris]QJR13362.1 Leucine-, isoleucine-, valine-, threonine-, and alanine-binding protein [Usitatibacter palustris]
MKTRLLTAALLAAGSLASPFAAAQVRVAYIDPLSGFMGATGERGLKELEFAAELINAKGGVLGQKIEILPMDNKLSAQESLILLKSAIDKGARYIAQGNGSSVAAALIDAVNKHNERNPGKEVVFLNYAAVDPEFTNDKCSFWHFRFDANSDMKLEALTTYMKGQSKIKKVYLFNQDYSFGHQVAKSARAMLNAKRPDVQIVGDELHPLARVKDFAPYIAKIIASGADSVVTGNWGSDLALLVKAAKDAGLKADFYTFYAGVIGTPPALGDAGVERVKVVSIWNANAASPAAQAMFDAYKKKHNALDDPYSQSARYSIEMLAKAMTAAKSTEPVKVARALENLKHEGPWGEVTMRDSDHQLIQPIFVGTFVKADPPGKYKYTADGVTGFAFREEAKFPAAATAPATTCKMRRP